MTLDDRIGAKPTMSLAIIPGRERRYGPMDCKIIWFRNDLRLHDHQPFRDACEAAVRSGDAILPVYCDDPRHSGETSFGFPRVGRHRRRFQRESLACLADRLEQHGSRLCILKGRPSEVLPQLAEGVNATGVYFHRELATEEDAEQDRLVRMLRERGITCFVSPANTLYKFDQLPFPVERTPEVFSSFRRKVEKKPIRVRCVEPPSSVPRHPLEIPGTFELQEPSSVFSVGEIETDNAEPLFVGGETAARQRVREYIWEQDCLRSYKQTRNGMLGLDYSSKFSPWLANGCLSPRFVFEEVCRYEQERIENDSTYWLKFELLWRDYFALMVAKHGSRIFQQGGLREIEMRWSDDWWAFDWWRSGQTGYPLIDANMRELEATGFMSNRGRQNVASFLSKNLGIDWRMGAEWFESLLVDYDPCSNYGNWNYVAGVGNDARFFRWFNVLKQSQQYDADGDYIRHWIPELRSVPVEYIHAPWQMPVAEQTANGCRIGTDYPAPIVDLFESADAGRQRYEAAVGAP